jgi:hypothetical protein
MLPTGRLSIYWIPENHKLPLPVMRPSRLVTFNVSLS